MGISRHRIALVQYASPDLVPGHLQIVAAVNYSGGSPPSHLKQISSYWYNPGDTIPDRYEKVGAVTYAIGAATPGNLPILAAMEPDIIVDGIGYSDLFPNGGYEAAGAGGADIWANWTEAASDGALADTTVAAEIHSGTHAAKVTSGLTGDTEVWQRFTTNIQRNTTYRWSFWTRGDGTNAGRYGVWDAVNSVWLVATQSTGISGTDYAEVVVYFTTSGDVSQDLKLTCRCSVANGGVAYYDGHQLTGPTR